MTIVPGASDYTSTLQKVFSTAPAGATVNFLPGSYNVAVGTTYVLKNSIHLAGTRATLINARIIAEANITINGLNFSEQDCTYTSANPTVCPVAGPMISIGAAGYTITQATISNINLQYTRAYTGIALGFGATQNVTISNFAIVDHELSGITVLGGSNISITTGTITGGADANVDDGIALDGTSGEVGDVTISGVQANNTFDVVGIGAHLYYPMHDITVTNSKCVQTAVCVYVKAGGSTPAPSQYAGYSQLERVTINGVTDQDPNGSRYLSTVWIFAQGGAKTSGITVNGISATTRSASAYTPRLWVFTDKLSSVGNTVFSNAVFTDIYLGAANSSSKAGFPSAEGLLMQDQGSQDINTLSLINSSVIGTAYQAIDSSQASVPGLTITNSTFTDINQAVPSWPLMGISYGYNLNGVAVN